MMQWVGRQFGSDRARALAGVTVLHALLFYALVTGLGVELGRAVGEQLRVFAVPVPPPPEVSVPAPVRIDRPEGAAAPPSREARPSPVSAPRRERRSPVRAVEKTPASGSEASAGASPTPGPGTGAGGQGSGLGSGGQGSGTGGGGRPTRAQRIAGALSDSDYPGSRRRGEVETVSVRFTVEADGRVSGCDVMRSSGNAKLDATTCRLIERRFRYRPATDARGKPVPSVVSTMFDWIPPQLARR